LGDKTKEKKNKKEHTISSYLLPSLLPSLSELSERPAGWLLTHLKIAAATATAAAATTTAAAAAAAAIASKAE